MLAKSVLVRPQGLAPQGAYPHLPPLLRHCSAPRPSMSPAAGDYAPRLPHQPYLVMDSSLCT